MIIIIDDQRKEAESLAQVIEDVTGVETCHHLPDGGYRFICENPWLIELVLIDEVFESDTSELFAGGTLLGEAISKQFDFIPMVLYTANALLYEVPVKAMSRGFCYALNKNEIIREDIEELPGAEIREVTDSEFLLERFKEIESSLPYQQITERRKTRRKEFIDQVLAGLNEHDLKELHNKIYYFQEPVKNFPITHGNKQLTLNGLLDGWIHVSQYSEDELRQFIIQHNLLPGGFVFKDAAWQEELKRYLQQENTERQDAIELKAINFLLEAWYIEEQYNLDSDQIYNLSKENKIKYATYSFNNRTVDNEFVFEAKMVARRVLIASPVIFESLGIRELAALIKDGKTSTDVNRVKKGKTSTDVTEKDSQKKIDPSSITRTQLQLNTVGGEIYNDTKAMLIEEKKWLQFVERDNIRQLKKLIEEFIMSDKHYTRDLNGLKIFLEDSKYTEETFAETVQRVQVYAQSYRKEILPIINKIIATIE